MLCHCLQGCLQHGASLFIAPMVVPLHVPCPAVPWQCHPEAQRQVLTLPAGPFGPGTANSAKDSPAPSCLQTWRCHWSRRAAGTGAAGKGHQAGDGALYLGQAKAAEVQPLPHHQRHGGEQSPQILLHVAVISVRKLPPSIINHTWLPARGTALGAPPLPRDGHRASRWSAGPCPAWAHPPWAIPELWDAWWHLGVLGKMAGAQVVEVALPWFSTDRCEAVGSLLAFGGSHGLDPPDPTPPTQSFCGSDIPVWPLLLHKQRQRAREGSPGRGKQQET